MKLKVENKGSTILPLLPVGLGIDIPTGVYIEGAKGEYILNGGIAGVTGVTGRGNMFKSTFTNRLMLKTTNDYRSCGFDAPMNTYDSEDNMLYNYDRINKLADGLDYIPNNPLYIPEIWTVEAKADTKSEEFIQSIHQYSKDKIKDVKKITQEGFTNYITNKPLTILPLNSVFLDSISMLESSTGMDTIGEGNLENSNTLYLKENMIKTKFMKDLPWISIKSNMRFYMTAHVGKEINIASGPFAPQPTKSLQHIKAGQKIKGVPDNIYYLSTHLFGIVHVGLLMNSGTKMPEYPLKGVTDNSTDLNYMNISMLRSKTGPSGHVFVVIVSQSDGVKESLTDFHNIKKAKFGLEGNDRKYNLILYPDVSMSRTTVRSLLDNDIKLQRAARITYEILQMKSFMKQYSHLYDEMSVIYKNMIERGYDWNYILEATTGVVTPKLYSGKKKYLSTLDILLLAKGEKDFKWLKNKK